MAQAGDVSFMSQSGAFVTAVLDWAAERDVGFKDIVSLGNKAVLDESDFVDQWGDDPDTDVILGYLEDVSDGAGFIETAREVTQETPSCLSSPAGPTPGPAPPRPTPAPSRVPSEPTRRDSNRRAPSASRRSRALFDYAQILSDQPCRMATR